MDRRQTGALAENSAAAFLESQGFTIVARNFLRRVGELDIVARAGDLLVIAEVRTRASDRFGGAAASIGRGKQRRIAATAALFLQQHRGSAPLPRAFRRARSCATGASSGCKHAFDCMKCAAYVQGRRHMKTLDELFKNNREWAEKIRRQDPEFFAKLSRQQSPNYLWIGCADSRVPANQIVGLLPGDIFVHRNIANMVVHTDLNCLSVMQFAVDILKVKHIIVVGHYGCSGVQAALRRARVGPGRQLAAARAGRARETRAHASRPARNEPAAADRLCELNVIEQVQNVCQTTIARDAWERGQELHVHGWIYGIADGLARDLGTTVSDFREAAPVYQSAAAIAKPRD